MAIENDEQLFLALVQASEQLQLVQEYVQRDFSKSAKLRFPRGYLKTAGQWRHPLRFLADSPLKKNISYTLMLVDVQHWILERTDLAGITRDMIVKLQMFLLGSIVESITKTYLHGICGGNYKRRTSHLHQQEIISQELCGDLDWLWDTRNNMHLFQVGGSEWETNQYTESNYIRAQNAYQGLVTALNAV